MNQPELTQQALNILRSGANFQWYVIPLLAAVLYMYANEYTKKNYKVIAAGLALYGVHWFYEILNALIQHFSGHALWTVPTGTAFLLLIGVGVELSLMFSVAGLIMAKFLPADQCSILFHFRDLSGHDPGFSLGVHLVGGFAGVCHRIYPILPGCLLLP
jgi:hypothetical protein